MKFKICTELRYEVQSPTTFIFNIQPPTTKIQNVSSESLVISNDLVYQEFSLSNNENRFLKVKVDNLSQLIINFEAIVNVRADYINHQQIEHDVEISDLNCDVLPYIAPSRHCESDKLISFATKKFGHLSSNFEKVLAVEKWVYDNVEYKYGTTSSNTSACDILISLEGVCKDFSHLAIALCRALDIPARYFTCYAFQLNPSDIHACFEVYLGGRWVVFDATRLAPINGFIKIASGKDASEVAIASYFGTANCTFMDVKTSCLENNFTPYNGMLSF